LNPGLNDGGRKPGRTDRFRGSDIPSSTTAERHPGWILKSWDKLLDLVGELVIARTMVAANYEKTGAV
jgi:hypothetical protein